MATPQSVVSDQQVASAFGVVTEDADPHAIDPNFSLPADGEAPSGANGADGEEGRGDQGAPSESERQAQDEARRFGWVDRDEWRGAPDRWRPASEFLDVRNGIKSVVEDENRFLKAKLATLEGKFTEREQSEARTRQEIERNALLRERAEAREAQDWERYDAADEKLMGMRVAAAAAPAKAAVDPAIAQAFATFGKENQSWLKDPDLKTDFMVELKAISEVDKNMDVTTALNHAKRRVMRANPAKFGKGKPGASMFEMGGGPSGGGNGGGRSWHDLRPEIRRQAEIDIAKGQYTQKDFLSNCEPQHFRSY